MYLLEVGQSQLGSVTRDDYSSQSILNLVKYTEVIEFPLIQWTHFSVYSENSRHIFFVKSLFQVSPHQERAC